MDFAIKSKCVNYKPPFSIDSIKFVRVDGGGQTLIQLDKSVCHVSTKTCILNKASSSRFFWKTSTQHQTFTSFNSNSPILEMCKEKTKSINFVSIEH